MSFAEVDEVERRPIKKRRFFVDDSPVQSEPEVVSTHNTSPAHLVHGASNGPSTEPVSPDTSNEFDPAVFESLVGQKLSDSILKNLRDAAGNNLERAINLYFDGSWASSEGTETVQTQNGQHADPQSKTSFVPSSHKSSPPEVHDTEHKQSVPLQAKPMPEMKYIGAFGATAWATKSGLNLIEYDEAITVERSKPPSQENMLAKSAKAKAAAIMRHDSVVRFLNSRQQEVGRLENECAAWVAPLLAQNICTIVGKCVYVPDRLHVNDTVYLQLRVYLKRRIFDAGNFIKPLESNRQAGIFDAKETFEERSLHLRQMALVRLFNEINLHPTRTNNKMEKHKRQGLLKATEIAEQYETTENKASTPGGSSPPSEDAEDGQELEQDQLDMLYKKAQSFDFDTPEYEPAETFAMELRKYQKQALHWMIGKEKDESAKHKEKSMHPLWEEYTWPTKDVDDQDTEDGPTTFFVNPYSGELSLDFPVQEQHCLGGVLADEMGLGKTIEMLSLIHSHKSSVAKEVAAGKGNPLDALPKLPLNSTATVSAPCTTLVVAPMSLLAQWESESHKASKDGTLKVLVYYGSDRAVNLQSLCCEANAANAPNVIITSYGNVLSEYNQVAMNNGNRGSHGGLFSLEYYRIILDEAHHIKNRQAKTSKACYELAARHRWCLTGTPIVNRLEDLFSLVHFLRVEPWSNFSFWKTFITVPFESKDYIKALNVVQTVLEPLVMRRTKDMKTPDGEVLVPLPTRTIEIEQLELSAEERDVYNLIFSRAKRTFAANVEAGTLMKSYTTIFAQILRLRQSCCHPVLTRNKNIVADEEDAAAAADAANGLADDMDLQNLIERFTVGDDDQDANKFGAHALKQIQDEASHECPICCEEPMIEQSVTGCWHSACKNCLIDYIDHQKDKNELPRCFNCREPINARDVFEVVRHDDHQANLTSSTDLYTSSPPDEATALSPTPRTTLRRINQPSSAKITALLSHLNTLRRTAPGTKSVVFSQFTSFLNIIEPVLTQQNIPFLRLDGTLAQKQRADVLARFCDSPPPGSRAGTPGTVLLLSLRAGGVGLNLTAATHVYMMDPWWSWAVEAQAIDRVHRMGQTSPVRVVRFVCADSIEEKMLRVQARKKFLAGSLGMMSEEERKMQRLEDIKELLSD